MHEPEGRDPATMADQPAGDTALLVATDPAVPSDPAQPGTRSGFGPHRRHRIGLRVG